MVKSEILKVLDDGGIICFAITSKKLLLLDAKSKDTTIKLSFEEFQFLQKEKMIDSKHRMLRQGHHTLMGPVMFYRKTQPQPGSCYEPKKESPTNNRQPRS